MILPTRTLLVCVFFLCGLEETVLAQHGHCAGNQCVALFHEPADNPSAQKSCKDSGGQLSEDSFDLIEKIFQSPLRGGRYWIGLPSAAVPRDVCVSISGSGQNVTEPCHRTLDGFLCTYTLDEPCGRVQAGDGAQVSYTVPMDFQEHESETFPQGTIAVTEKVGGNYPDSKHLCFSSNWMRAPWNCEVMRGGCEHNCSSAAAATHTCACPAGKTLHPNNITCGDGPCKENPCTGEGRECEPTRGGGFTCTCKDGFEEEDGVCVNTTICFKCEHWCEKVNGVYQCVCKKGFTVSEHDPTKCKVTCNQTMDCPATCVLDKENNKYQCFCPDGYIKDVHDGNNSVPFCTDINECDSGHCDHKCENLFGGYRCSCDKGFKLHRDGNKCEEDDNDDDGSGSTPAPYPTPLPAGMPSYVKTGSVLGITVFLALCSALVFFLIRNAVKRCGKFELSSLKHPDIDIFYLQQVTTETYKRLSVDKQCKNDS